MKNIKYKICYCDDIKNIFNRCIQKEKTRSRAMSVYFYIADNIDEECEFLNTSLDYIYEKRYRLNAVKKGKKYFSLAYFKKLANLLEEIGLIKSKFKGRLKFYGLKEVVHKVKEKTKELFGKIVHRETNEKEEKKLEHLKETEEIEVIDNREIHISKEDVAEQEIVIETAYKMMEEANIEAGSIVFKQIIESLYIKTDKEKIHNKGLYSYIRKVIHNKVHNQTKFKDIIRNQRKNSTSNWSTKKEENKFNELEKQLLGW